MTTFRITVASPPDREHLVAEVFVESEQIAEINQEGQGGLSIEIYPRSDGKAWRLPYAQLVQALSDAQHRLTGDK